jgi:hypothetical protein
VAMRQRKRMAAFPISAAHEDSFLSNRNAAMTDWTMYVIGATSIALTLATFAALWSMM